MLFSKPYPIDYRRPVDAEIILDNQLELTFSLLREKGICDDEIAIGFLDETRPQNTANTGSGLELRTDSNDQEIQQNSMQIQ